MRTGRKVASLAFTGAVVALQAGPALAAAGTWHIQAPKGTPYHGVFKVRATGAGVTVVDANHRSLPLTCTSATGSGSLPHSTVTGTTATTTLGHVKAARFAHCSEDGLLVRGAMTAKLGAASYNPTTEVAKGKLTNVALVWTGSGNSCHATMTGTLPISYHNTTHRLVVDTGNYRKAKATLTIRSLNTGCVFLGFGGIGDKAFFTTTYSTTTPKSLWASGPA